MSLVDFLRLVGCRRRLTGFLGSACGLETASGFSWAGVGWPDGPSGCDCGDAVDFLDFGSESRLVAATAAVSMLLTPLR